MIDKWDERFLDLAHVVASWSKDVSTKCGCVLVSPDRRYIFVGYNGFPRGMSDDEPLYENRPVKYSRVIHAEENAVLNAKTNVEGYNAYVTGPCCQHCCVVLIQAGIKRVVWSEPSDEFAARWGDSMINAWDFFQEAGVEVIEVP